MLKYLEAFIGEKVVGFSQTRIKKLDSEWRPLEEVVKEKVEEYLEDVTVEELRDAKFSGTYAFSSKFCNLKRLEEDLSIFHHQDGAMVTYIMACNEIAETRKIADKIWSALSLLDYDLGQPKEVPIAAQYAKAVDAYRLLPYIEGYNMKEETYQEVIRYINLIDAELASAAALVALAS
jgi:hypothetical protein